MILSALDCGGGTVRSRRVRVLIIEDSISFQKMIRLVIEQNAEFEIVGLASDGVEGVRKAEELTPDLILLDLGLPKLNGFDVARTILKRAPERKIVMVTQESSTEFVRESLRIGAFGYVRKDRLVSDLLPAAKAVLGGHRFTSDGLHLHDLDQQAQPAAAVPSGSLPPSRAVPLTSCHKLQVHSHESVLIQGVTSFVGSAIADGQPAIVIASQCLREKVLAALRSNGLDIQTAIRQGTLICLNVEEVMSLFMLKGTPDMVRFTEFMGGLIRASSQAGRASGQQVSVFAECTAWIWSTGKTEAALRVERLWNHLASRQNVNILCAYGVTSFHGEEDCEEIRALCEEHSFVSSR